MHIYQVDVVFQEIPDEISLCFFVAGCDVRCVGCHSAHTWSVRTTPVMPLETYEQMLHKYIDKVSCVLFMGGEWDSDLPHWLSLAKHYKYKTALYTGRTSLPDDITIHLDYVKYGPWIEKLGGLSSKTTNQRLYDLRTETLLNHRFYKD